MNRQQNKLLSKATADFILLFSLQSVQSNQKVTFWWNGNLHAFLIIYPMEDDVFLAYM